MISRRLTKSQKNEIVESYKSGENTNMLAEKYGCSTNTINRTVKSLLSDSEYELLKEKRLKTSSKKVEPANNQVINNKQVDIEKGISFDSHQSKINDDENSIKADKDFCNSEFEEIAFLPMKESSNTNPLRIDNSYVENKDLDSNNKLEEIVPLVSSFDFEKEKLDFEICNQEILPESVYMIVDKKVELEVKPISEMPEWSFLPENELKRNAILLFSNQRTAKRSCSRNQRVIKIPNTSVFEISKSYLIAKGVTRLILEDSVISLDH